MGRPDFPLFTGGEIHACHKLGVPQQEAPIPYIINVHKTGRVPKHCIAQCDSLHAVPVKAMEYSLSDLPQGYGNTADLSCSDIWVREPD